MKTIGMISFRCQSCGHEVRDKRVKTQPNLKQLKCPKCYDTIKDAKFQHLN